MLIYEFKKGAEAAVNIKTTYGVTVESSEGMIGRPKMKSVEAFDWKYLNGSTPDLHNRRYVNREIELHCWITASTKQGMIDRMNNLTKFFASDELIFMHVSFDNNDGSQVSVNKGLFYMVYLDSISEPNFKWRFGKQLAKFTIRLIEPCPVKKVMKLTSTSGETAIDYDISSETDIDIYTSGGVKVLGVTEGTGTIEMENGEYVIAAGDIEHADHITFDPQSAEDTFETIYTEI